MITTKHLNKNVRQIHHYHCYKCNYYHRCSWFSLK